MLHALLPVIKRVQKSPPYRYRRSAQTERFEDIGAAAEAAVDVDFQMIEDVGRASLEFEEDEEGGGGGVEVAASMVTAREQHIFIIHQLIREADVFSDVK